MRRVGTATRNDRLEIILAFLPTRTAKTSRPTRKVSPLSLAILSLHFSVRVHCAALTKRTGFKRNTKAPSFISSRINDCVGYRSSALSILRSS